MFPNEMAIRIDGCSISAEGSRLAVYPGLREEDVPGPHNPHIPPIENSHEHHFVAHH